jgi:hypothetical protein
VSGAADANWPPEALPKLLHVYAQGHPHGAAEIIGTPEALMRLSQCLYAVAVSGNDKGVEMMVRDGEHYPLMCRAATAAQIDSEPLPYSTLGERDE